MKVEEAIELLEEMKENCIDKGKTYYEDDKRVKKAQAIETVLKEREILQRYIIDEIEIDCNNMKVDLYKNYISKDKIKAKIEELKQAETLPLKNGEIDLYYFAEDILKELLEEE